MLTEGLHDELVSDRNTCQTNEIKKYQKAIILNQIILKKISKKI